MLTKVSAGVLNIDDLYGFRNRIINGAMAIDQRNAGVSFSPGTSGAVEYSVDRFGGVRASSGVAFTLQQVADAPAGFVNSLQVTVPTGATPSSTQLSFLQQPIEGFNISDFGWGGANAQTVTLSFWVKSSLTGSFPLVLVNNGVVRAYGATYTINAANTWEYKTLTIAGDTTGTWLTNTGRGVGITWGLGGAGASRTVTTGWQNTSSPGSSVGVIAGTVNLVATTGATLNIPGVQLEVGSVATPFERKPCGTELALCQRYCYTLFATDCATDNFARFALGDCDLTDRLQGYVWFPVTMRVAPSLTATAANTFTLYSAGATNTCTQVNVAPTVTSKIGLTQLITSATLTAGRAGQILANNNRTAYLIYSAEL